ncbi:MAG: hypothetical protein K8S98_00125, partial [Planctomycetes bacterium]|nr:hypothetical protein [Planctomycetota bacterium]
LEQWPYFVLAAAAAGVAAWAQNESAAVVPWNEHGLLQRTAQAAYGLVFYVWKTTWPTDLSPMYILERDLDPSRVKYVVSMVLVAVVGIACLGSRKRLPGVVTTLAVYAVVVSPVLGFLQSGAQLVADRYTYLACIPLAALFAALLVVAARKQALAVWLGVVPLPILFALTWRQTQVWSDPVVFYERVVAVEPDNYIGQHNLAAQIRIRSDRAPVDRNAELRRAVEHELLSIQAHPVRGNEGARHDLGVLYLLLGERAKTEEAWRECVRVSPDNVQCLEELWNLLLSRGDLAGATALFEQALVAQPPNLGVRELYANLLVKRGDRANAERIWRDGLAAEPRWVVGLVGHAECALNQSRMGEAEAELRQALALDGRNVEGWVLLGRALRGQRKVTEAEQCWQTALLLAPGHPGATALLEKSRQESAAGR